MSNNFSSVVRIGKNASTRQAGSTTATSFSGACDVGYGEKKQTLWLNCTVFGDRGAKLEQYLTKGGQCWVAGELSQREYEGKQYLELNVSQLDLVGKKSDSPAPQTKHHEQKSNGYAPGHDDDFDQAIPF